MNIIFSVKMKITKLTTNIRIKNCIVILGSVSIICMVGTIFINNNEFPPNLLENQWKWLYLSATFFLLIWGGIFIFAPSKGLSLFQKELECILVIFGGIEAVWGMLQILGVCKSNHLLFILTGHFYNPGPYGGYLASILPIVIYKLILVCKRNGLKSKFLYYIILTDIVIISSMILVSVSRASLIASCVSSFYIFIQYYKIDIKSYILKFRNIISIGILLSLLITIGLYYLKKESADGRIFIWKISLNIIGDNPLGNSSKKFSAIYGEALEKYFNSFSNNPIEKKNSRNSRLCF